MPIEPIENFIRSNPNIIRQHSWVTAPLDNFENSPVLATHIDNMVSFRQLQQSVYAIQPNYFEAAESYFLNDFGAEFDNDANIFTPYLGHPYGSGLDFGE